MTLSQARTRLDIRSGRQYNQDDDGKAILNDTLNDAAQYCWEYKPLGFNEVEIDDDAGTWPTISNDEFTLPTAAKSLLLLKKSTGTGSANYEDNVDFNQERRVIKITNTNSTPTRMVYHSFWTVLSADSDVFPSYIPGYLIIDLAQYFFVGETKDIHDGGPVMINKAMTLFKEWIRGWDIRRHNVSEPYGQDGQRIDRRGGIYSSGLTEGSGSNDKKGWG